MNCSLCEEYCKGWKIENRIVEWIKSIFIAELKKKMHTQWSSLLFVSSYVSSFLGVDICTALRSLVWFCEICVSLSLAGHFAESAYPCILTLTVWNSPAVSNQGASKSIQNELHACVLNECMTVLDVASQVNNEGWIIIIFFNQEN